MGTLRVAVLLIPDLPDAKPVEKCPGSRISSLAFTASSCCLANIHQWMWSTIALVKNTWAADNTSLMGLKNYSRLKIYVLHQQRCSSSYWHRTLCREDPSDCCWVDKNSLFRAAKRKRSDCIPMQCVSQDVVGPKTKHRPESGRTLLKWVWPITGIMSTGNVPPNMLKFQKVGNRNPVAPEWGF